MKTIKRWTSSVAASFDWMVTQVENHEALVNSAIREVQEARARAQVQLKRVRNDGQGMRKRLVELAQAAEQWKERAMTAAKTDEQKAVECLRRQRRAAAALLELEEQERAHAKLEKQLTADLGSIDERLVTLKQQRNLMRTRQSRAEALKTLQGDDSRIISEIDDIFERWEIKVSEYEIEGSCVESTGDALEEQFNAQEEETALKEELKMLLATQGQTNS